MRIEIFSDFTPELEKIWCEFETEALGTPFQSYAWLSHWQNTIGAPLLSVKPQVVLVNANGKLKAIFPLCIRKSMGIFILEWLGGEQTDYMLPLLNKESGNYEKDFPVYWKNVINNLDSFDVIHFQKQKEYIGIIRNPFVMLIDSYKNLLAYQVNLKISWREYYEETVKNKLRADSRRQNRRLAEIGELRFVVAQDRGTKKIIIDKMIEQKSLRYRDTGVWDMLAVPEHKTFYEKLVDVQNDHWNIHCAALFVGDTVVATHVGILDVDKLYYLMPAHEGGDWEKFSPGRLLLEKLMEWSIQKKLKVFDFTVGVEQYKKVWCDTETSLYETLEAVTFKGLIYTLAQRTKQSIKQRPWLGQKVSKLNYWLKN